jgi:glycosyltransferase involved in cell wall biosynthesis
VLKVACVNQHDLTDPDAFGGRLHYMMRALQHRRLSLEFLSLSRRRPVMSLVLARKLYHEHLASSRLRYDAKRDRFLVRDFARQISSQLRRTDAEVVLSPMSQGSQPVAYLDCDQPIVIWTDATFASTIDVYSDSKAKLADATIRDGLANDRAALSRCTLAIYSSEWAANAAVDHYAIDPTRVAVVPFGANIDCQRTARDVERLVALRSRATCRLIFISSDWERKGGDTAVEMADLLNQQGLRTELAVIGASPRSRHRPLPDCVTLHGKIAKSTAEGAERFDRLMQEAHFLVLPTTADATPMVCAEASSFGVPSIVTDVGGVSSLVANGRNGQRFPKDAPATDYCEYVTRVFLDRDAYERLALSSFDEYESRLNWDSSAQRVEELLLKMVA